MITGNENIQTLAGNYPELLPVFEKHGLGSYFKPENLKKIGRFTLLSTLLRSERINSEQFIGTLNNLTGNHSGTAGDERSVQQLHFMAMLPCGLRNPFKDFLEAHLLEHPDQYADLNYLAEGNVNHELSYYPMLDNVASADELPDMIMASDVNNFFHRPFTERFIRQGIYEAFTPFTPTNAYLEKAGFADPSGNFTMYTANMLVMAVDTERPGAEKLPRKWEDLLNPVFENGIIMRGEDDFFCNAVMLPFYKDHGFDAIRIMAQNIRTGKHPAEMVKLAESGKDGAATVYIMPYFFAKKIKNPMVKLVWPEDGAIASPVFMLVKKKAIEKHRSLLEFLLSKATGEMLVSRFFPSIHPEVKNTLPEPVKWLGWDFLSQNDIGTLKDEIRHVFMDVWKQKRIQDQVKR